jgi:Predicted membrane protein
LSAQSVSCAVCGQNKLISDTIPGILVRPAITALIRKDHPHWGINDHICHACHNLYRTQYVMDQMAKDRGELTALDAEVIESIKKNQTVTDNINNAFEANQTLGGKVADKVAEFGGSWKFIFLFFSVMTVWIAANSISLLWKPFDPYPFILFNLILSMLAAIQAPIIMMSQNRQEARDRMRAENDYQVNLKAEIEIRVLTEKMDQLLHHQWQRLLEIQRLQTEMIEDLASRAECRHPGATERK